MPGKMVTRIRIKDDAVPIDDITKFAWDPDDYEEVEEWHEFTEEELAAQQWNEEYQAKKQAVDALPENVSDLEEAVIELGSISNDNAISNEDLMDAIAELGVLISELMEGNNG